MKDEIFALEAKTAPNQWEEISRIYPEIEMKSRYTTQEEALVAKSQLKMALTGPWKKTYKKKPIRVSRYEID